jgi:polysaccharide chain length determinant protein (PEP-CTERM system associated)
VTHFPIHAVIQDLLDQLRGTWRYRWVALAAAWLVALALWAIIFLVPDSYQASARVFIDTQTTLSEATQGIGLGEEIDSQVQRVREALLGWPELERVAEETDLLAGTLSPPARQEVLEKLRRDIDITGDLARGGAAVFTISYVNRSRAESLRVVDRLLNTFVEGALGGKRRGSEEAQQFLISQIADLEHRLSAAEQRLADFKRRNVGLMPGEEGDYFTRLQSESDALTRARGRLAMALGKRAELLRELQGGQPFQSAAATDGAAGSGRIQSDTERRIEQTRMRLDDLLLRFTDKYPDVIALRQTLRGLDARRAAELAAAQHGDPGAAARLGMSANPVYQKIEEQYDQEQVDIASMRQDIADRERTIAALRAAVNTAPEVEAQLAKLNRDYQVTRAQYNALLVRLERARLGQQAMATGIVKFQVIDPPTANFSPVAPRRRLLISASLLLALAAGVGVAYVLYLLRPVFVSTRQLAAVTGLQVLGAVGMAWIDKYHARRRRSNVLYAGAAAALLFAGGAVLALHSSISNLIRELLV